MQKTSTTIDDLITHQTHLSRIISSKQLEPIEYISVLQAMISVNQEIRKMKVAEKYSSSQSPNKI
jgi:hypothetical protein